jgi:hypothetical protein
MRISAQARLPLIWFALAGGTLVSWWIGARHAQGVLKPSAAVSLAVIGIAVVKVRVILREFMEVRHAPVLLRRLTDAWLGLFVAAVVATYFVGGA